MADAKRGNFLRFLTLFLVLYLGMQLLMGVFFPQQSPQQVQPGPHLTASSSFTIGNHPLLSLENRPVRVESKGMGVWVQSKWCALQRRFTGHPEARECAALAATYTGDTLRFTDRCPQPPLELFVVENPGTPQEKLTPITSSETVVACAPIPDVMPGETVEVSLAPWKYSLFEKTGVYEARVVGADTEPVTASGTVIVPPTVTRFAIKDPAIYTKIFRTFITAPFLNFLVFIASWLPGHNLGIAIIILTLVVKLLLFFPTQHALEGQKKMQLLQPKLEALKKQYPGDNKRIQEETMKLWKEHKINPFQSCLPLLIQFPVLIGVFYVVRDGSEFLLSRHLLYGAYQTIPWEFGTNFLGLNLLVPNVTFVPIMLVVLQFLQMKLTFSIQKRKKKKEDVIDIGKQKEKQPASPQDMQQKIMLYGLPLMIGFFAIGFPSAVSVYWGVSTLFAIGQQMIVNREHLRV